MSNFDPNAILRGVQLTLVGANRALQNPNLFKHDIYRQAAIAVALGIGIRLLVAIPILVAKAIIWLIDLFTNLDAYTWDEQVVDSLHFVQNSVLQIPFFLMSLMKFISPAYDNMFMESLEWVDKTYVAKHSSDDSKQNLRDMYYQNLQPYDSKSAPRHNSPKQGAQHGITHFLIRYGRKALFSISILILSYVPYIGKFVLPGVSFYYFNIAVGPKPAVVVFASGLVLPKKYLVTFLQTYFSSRSLMRELLEPYFSRIPFTSQQKRRWFLDREGVLFGFGIGFFILVKIPLVGVLVYGIAEASTAYLITKITDPPPPPAESEAYTESQTQWTNKNKFLTLPLFDVDSGSTKGHEASDLHRRPPVEGWDTTKFS